MSQTPVFDIGATFPHLLQVGDRTLPIIVQNLTKAELRAYKQEFDALFMPRGEESTQTAAERAAADEARGAFTDRVIRAYITLPAGVLRLRGDDVTTGAGLIDAFHARQDVLGDVLWAIWSENLLSSVIRKNSSSPLASEPSSAPSMPESGHRGGERASTAASADGSSSVPPEAVAPAALETTPDALSSSGVTPRSEAQDAASS